MKKEKLIILCVSIIAIGLIWSQSLKNDAAREQTQMKIDQENKVAQEIKSKEALSNVMFNVCVNDAEDSYWNYMELNGTGTRNTSVNAPTYVWNIAKQDKKDAIDLCNQKYK